MIKLLVVCSVVLSTGYAATPNADDKYQKWADPGRVLYQTATDFDPGDMQVLLSAMQQVSLDSGMCIKFQRYDNRADAGKDYIYISNKLSGGKAMSTCYTFPGRSVEQQGRGQYMVLFSSRTAPGAASQTATVPGACLDTVRDAMKYLFQALGFRSEYGRTDRVNYLDFLAADPNSLVAKSMAEWTPFKIYQPGEASFYNLFDPLSITMVDGKKWAKNPMNPVFTPKSNVWIGGKPNLSQQDCQALAMYGCDTIKCQNPYSLLGGQGILVTPLSTPMDANGVCATGQQILLGSVMASGLTVPKGPQAGIPFNPQQSAVNQSISGSGIVQGAFISGEPSIPSGPALPGPMMMSLPVHERAGLNSPYAFSVAGSNPYNFQIIPDPVDPSKANIIINSAARSFTNAQITVQAANINAPQQTPQVGQALVSINLNCGPLFMSYPPGSSSAASRLNFPSTPIRIVCDGNMLQTPMIIGTFTAQDPDSDTGVTYYISMSNKFQISSVGVLVLVEAPASGLGLIPVNINAMDANGAVTTLHLSIQFSCA
ncbi:uncharacterized protein LOC129598531 [Paramacrobiotus metropolitanus]|uniref:uncharacterized protein LOC129598531 n=1 Tax=Paramacrobiotus metropolitanus TaxID=2943436 RepID=UPI002446252F|nr:uncharacterized protein LOC129598531 [Paramacrobiotus metropolitanus]